jgi:hypothetical protein
MQTVDVYAEYDGDPGHLPSQSQKVTISFGPVSFSISPTSATVATSQMIQFTQTGGMTPIRWIIESDSACPDGGVCSTLNEQTGAFVAGLPGTVVVRALDHDGAEQTATVNVVALDAGTPDAGSGSDAGAATDAGSQTDAGSTADAGAKVDAGEGSDAGLGSPPDAGSGPPMKSGCGCQEAASWPALWAAAMALRALRRRR